MCIDQALHALGVEPVADRLTRRTIGVGSALRAIAVDAQRAIGVGTVRILEALEAGAVRGAEWIAVPAVGVSGALDTQAAALAADRLVAVAIIAGAASRGALPACLIAGLAGSAVRVGQAFDALGCGGVAYPASITISGGAAVGPGGEWAVEGHFLVVRAAGDDQRECSAAQEQGRAHKVRSPVGSFEF
jgi:hypothetical protein